MTERIDSLFERRLRNAMRGVLGAEQGPHAAWAGSPAARRVAGGEGTRRSSVGNLRLLAIAAVLLVGGAAAAGAALRLLPTTAPVPTTLNVPTPPVPTPPSATPVASQPAAGVRNGLLAYELNGDVFAVRADGQGSSEHWGGDGVESCPQFLPDGSIAIAHVNADSSLWQISVDAFEGDGSLVQGGFTLHVNEEVSLDELCFEASYDAQRFAFLAPPDADTSVHRLVFVRRDAYLQEQVLIGRGEVGVPQFSAFAWSPVASELAVARRIDQAGADASTAADLWLVRINADGHEIHIARPNEIINSIAWSPDGTRLAYRGTILERTTVDGVPHIEPVGTFVRVVDSAVTNATPVEIDELRDPEFMNGSGPAWSPDGSQLAWVLGGELRVGTSDGSNWRALPPVSSDDLGIGWATDPVIWSADGSQLLVGQLSAPTFSQGVQTSVVLYKVDSNGQPASVLPWREGGYGRVSWQVLSE